MNFIWMFTDWLNLIIIYLNEFYIDIKKNLNIISNLYWLNILLNIESDIQMKINKYFKIKKKIKIK